MKNPYWNSPVFQVVKGMKASGNMPGMVARWIEAAAHWAGEHAPLPEAKAIQAMLPYWRARPFYTASELAPIFPALMKVFGIADKQHEMSGARLGYMLDDAGLPKLKNANGSTFFHDAMGVLQEYYVVERLHHWSTQVFTQDEFEEILFGDVT